MTSSKEKQNHKQDPQIVMPRDPVSYLTEIIQRPLLNHCSTRCLLYCKGYIGFVYGRMLCMGENPREVRIYAFLLPLIPIMY